MELPGDPPGSSQWESYLITVPKTNFEQADINNDEAVGAPDLTVTTSNFGNSEGFGAPPVYKVVARGDNSAARLELEPRFDFREPLKPGQRIEVVVKARQLDDLAGYEFDLDFDHRALRLLDGGAVEGDIFAPNPRGSIFETRQEDGHLQVIAARIGKQWSAQGEGVLTHLRFEVLQDGGAASLKLNQGTLLNADYEQLSAFWDRSLVDWLLPAEFELAQNYPNPFNPATAIPFALVGDVHVRLYIYNVLGQKIRSLVDGPMPSGYHRMVWDGYNDRGSQVGTGIYFYLLEAGTFRQTRKMTLIK